MITEIKTLSYSWGEFYETMRTCDGYDEEMKRKFAIFEALDSVKSFDEIPSIIKPLKEIEINWLNSPCLDGIILAMTIYPRCEPIRTIFENRKDNVEACKYFLRKNLGVDRSLLTDACRNGLIKIVTLLLDIGSNTGQDFYHRYPIIEAASNGHVEIVKLLIEKGAVIDPRDNEPLRLASKHGHLEVVKLLLKNGANMYSPSQIIGVFEGDVLTNACERGHIEIARFLLDSGVNIHTDDDAALRYSYQHIEVIKLLLERGADIHARLDQVLEHTCSMSELVKITKFLLDNGANLHARNEAALKTACTCNNIEAVKLLIEYGANIHIQNEYALYDACHKGFVDIIKLLIEKGAVVTIENLQNVIIYQHNAKVLKILLDNMGINIMDEFYTRFQKEINMAKVIVDFVERKKN